MRLVRVSLLTEERCGGRWYISSVNSATTLSTSARGTEECIRIIPTYSLGKIRSNPSAFVALPETYREHPGDTRVEGAAVARLVQAREAPHP